MKLESRQDRLYLQIASPPANISVVPVMQDYANDDRICLTLVHFLDRAITRRIIDEVIRPLKDAEPGPYYYDEDSLHCTINNVRAIAKPVNFNELDIEKLRKLELPSVQLKIKLKGLLLTPGSVLIKGYPDKETNEFILGLRKKMEEIGVPDDKVYADPDVTIAPISICRLYSRPTQAFLDAFGAISEIDLGEISISEFSLVSCNAVCKKRKMLHTHRI